MKCDIPGSLQLPGTLHDALDHVLEYEGVEGQHRVPVEPAQDATRQVIRRLGQCPAVDPELEPGFAEDHHLGLKQEPLVLDQIYHQPDVQHVTDAEVGLDPPPHRSAEPSNELVHQPPDLPKEIEREPPLPPPDGFHAVEYTAGGQIAEINGLDVAKNSAGHFVFAEGI